MRQDYLVTFYLATAIILWTSDIFTSNKSPMQFVIFKFKKKNDIGDAHDNAERREPLSLDPDFGSVDESAQ